MAEPTVPPPPRKDLPLNDSSAFPCLTDKDGWEVLISPMIAPEPESGRAWSDRAKRVASVPAPKISSDIKPVAFRKRQQRQASVEGDGCEVESFMDEYALRSKKGAQRAQDLARAQRARDKLRASLQLVAVPDQVVPDELADSDSADSEM